MIFEPSPGPGLQAATGVVWRCVSDQVMGGVSDGTLTRTTVGGTPALLLRGTVSLENNGGFLQMALDLAPRGQVFDATGFTGIALRVRGNGARYNLHLRSADMGAVWQSWRASFSAPEDWVDLHVPFDAFTPHRTDLPVNPARLTRMGLVGIGAAMEVELALAALSFQKRRS